MRLKSVSLAAAAIALGTAPIAAQAAIASRDAAPVDGASELGSDSATQLVALAVIAALIFAAIKITDNDDPLSP